MSTFELQPKTPLLLLNNTDRDATIFIYGRIINQELVA